MFRRHGVHRERGMNGKGLDKSSQSSQNNVSAITLATNLSVTLIIIVDQ